jgi:hypothetical protein
MLSPSFLAQVCMCGFPALAFTKLFQNSVPMNDVAFPMEATLLDAETYRRYAAECVRIASKMEAKDRKTLLEIAEAWEARAQEAERTSRVPPKPKLDGGDMANN